MTQRDQSETSASALAPVDEWRRELALRTDLAEIRTMHNLAESVRKYGETEEMRRHASVAKLWAAFRGGEVLADLERQQGARTELPASNAGSSAYRQAFEDADLAERTARYWQELYALGEDRLERYVASDREAKEVTLARALRLRRDQKAKTVPAVRGKHQPILRTGRFQDELTDIADHSVDAILTDPPYERDAIPELADLAAFARRVLTPDGVMVVLYGHTWLPDALAALASGPPWRWCGCYLEPGAGYALPARRVQSNWKPLLIYGKGPRFGDVIESTGDDKDHHIWGQNADAWIEIVDRFVDETLADPLVVDPFLGGGTTAMAAVSAGCRFIGCDVDDTAVAVARERLAA
jgi:SAM-dependent methyltransferase